MDIKEVAYIIRQCRKKSHLSQLELAQLAGVGKTVVFDVEKGKISVQLDSLLKILEVLNIKLEFHPPIALEVNKDEKGIGEGA